MLSTKPVLPNFLKTLVITSMAFGSVAAFAGHHEEGEKIGDLKDMKAKHSLKAEELTNQLDADATASSLTEESENTMEKADSMLDKAEEIKPGE